MSNLLDQDARLLPQPRYSVVEQHKADGATYTPKSFADFVAAQIIAAAELPKQGFIRVLDPACGDGALLYALLDVLPQHVQSRLEVVGFDTDEAAVCISSARLREAFPAVSICVEQRDFLEYVLNLEGSGDLFSEKVSADPFDLVISNPPYVRTQIMGAQQAQVLAEQFGLTGRVDLYYPFLLGISHVLAKNGVAGIIVSNRFMTTKSGQAVRRQLLTRFRLRHVWDMGDTKLFDAAVLPAVLLATGQGAVSPGQVAFSSIYETKDDTTERVTGPLDAMSCPNATIVAVHDGRRFKVLHGTLDNGSDPEGVWRLATEATDSWLATVEAHTWAPFSRIGKIRVGVKSTADKVFIRSDWDAMPESERPELLMPLTTRHCARRFKANVAIQPKRILYPHEVTPYGRAPVELERYPKTARYLEVYRNVLEARTYVIEAGRQWYEIWVPQDPAAWVAPKLVFLDISEKPTFWIDLEGTIVNGECYWLRCEGNAQQDWLWLALAVANSTFIESFYDHRFNNKLYAGRRRFITQYVEQFPLPDPDSDLGSRIIATAKRIYDTTPSVEADALAHELDAMVWCAFGLPVKEVLR
jgi:SAM-dependent methyltransferase